MAKAKTRRTQAAPKATTKKKGAAAQRPARGKPAPARKAAKQKPAAKSPSTSVLAAMKSEMSKPDIRDVDLALIRIDGGTQPREHLNQDIVDEYAAAMREEAEFPAADVFFDGSHFWLANGFHRYHANRGADRTTMACDVHRGTRRDAVLFSCGANATHGLRRTNPDKRRAVLILLKDPEWSKWSDREISRQCKVSHNFVGDVRRELAPRLSSDDSQVRRTGADGRSIAVASEARSAAAQKRVVSAAAPSTVPRGAASPAAPPPRVTREGAQELPDYDAVAPTSSGESERPPVEDDDGPARLLDGLGDPVPDSIRVAFELVPPRAKRIVQLLDQVAHEHRYLIADLQTAALKGHLPGDELAPLGQLATLEAAWRDLQRQYEVCVPYATCPSCRAVPARVPNCTTCSGGGWLSRPAHEAIAGEA